MPSKKKTKKLDKVPDIDFSVLRTAIKIGGRMINQIINGVHYGSHEVQHLLFEESDFIIECRVCRNLFRSLPNFIAHKRIYCQDFFVDSIKNRDGFPNVLEEETIVVEPQAPDETNERSQSAESTVNKLINGEFQSSSPAYNFYTDMAQRIESQKMNKTVLSMKLSKIPTNPNAVMVSMGTEQNDLEVDLNAPDRVQPSACSVSPAKMEFEKSDSVEGRSTPKKGSTVGNVSENQDVCLRRTARVILKRKLDMESCDDIKTKNENQKPNTVNNAEEAKKSVLSSSSPRKSERGEPTRPVELLKQSTLLTRVKADGLLQLCDLKALECLQCKQKYASRKSLLHHLQAKHSGKRMQHPCIYCNKQFSYFWGLTRHLMGSHNKTRNQVDKMRKKLWQHVHKVNENNDNASETTSPSKSRSSKGDGRSASTKKVSTESPSKSNNKNLSTTEAPTASIVDQLQDRLRMFGDSKSRSFDIHRCIKCGKAFWKNSNYESHVKICGRMKSAKKDPDLETGIERVQRRVGKLDKTEKKTATIHQDENSQSVECDMQSSSLVEEKESGCLISDDLKTDKENLVSQKSTTAVEQQTMSSSEEGSPRSIKEEKDNTFDSLDLEEAFSVEDVLCDEKDEDNSERKELTPEEEMLLVEEIWVNKQPGKPPEKVKSNRIYVVEPKTSKPFSHCQDSKKINLLVDEVNLRCLECNMAFSSVSNVRRHVVRHLGWKRYKCKMCKFMSYNKSECNTHLYRTHSDRTRGFKANTFIVDLNKEASRLRNLKKQQTLSGKQAAEKFDPFGKSPMRYRYSSRYRSHSGSKTSEDRRKPGVSEENIKGPDVNRFNISTRNSTREFDTRPYQVVDRMSTLFTRKGYYPKTGVKKDRSSNSVKGSETEDDALSTISHTSTRSTRSRASDSKFHSQSKVRIQGVPECSFMIKNPKEQTLLNRNIFESFKNNQIDSTDFLSNMVSAQLVEVQEDLILRDSVENLDHIQRNESENMTYKTGQPSEDHGENSSDPIQVSDDGIENVTSSDSVQGETLFVIDRTEQINDDGLMEEGHYLIERPEFSTSCKFPKWSARRYRNQLNQDSNGSMTSSGNSDTVPSISKTEDESPTKMEDSSKNEKVAEGEIIEIIKPEHLVKKSVRIAAIKNAQDSVTKESENSPVRSKRVSPKTAKHIELKRLSLPGKQNLSSGKKGSGSVKHRKSLGSHGSAHWSGAVKSKVDWAKCTSVKQSACWRKGAPFASRFVAKSATVTKEADPVESSKDDQ